MRYAAGNEICQRKDGVHDQEATRDEHDRRRPRERHDAVIQVAQWPRAVANDTNLVANARTAE